MSSILFRLRGREPDSRPLEVELLESRLQPGQTTFGGALGFAPLASSAGWLDAEPLASDTVLTSTLADGATPAQTGSRSAREMDPSGSAVGLDAIPAPLDKAYDASFGTSPDLSWTDSPVAAVASPEKVHAHAAFPGKGGGHDPGDGPAPTLIEAWIFFHTNDEDKDWDTQLTVTFRQTDQNLAARLSCLCGYFPDHSDNGPFFLDILNPGATRDDLGGGTGCIRIDPNGHDTWRFNYVYQLTFSDGGAISDAANGLQLSQDYRETCFGLPP